MSYVEFACILRCVPAGKDDVMSESGDCGIDLARPIYQLTAVTRELWLGFRCNHLITIYLNKCISVTCEVSPDTPEQIYTQ